MDMVCGTEVWVIYAWLGHLGMNDPLSLQRWKLTWTVPPKCAIYQLLNGAASA
ncbi:hypothetical protein HG15A2_49110 [Adhaeretor mobilis]|uniref:Uncharacterized protein n=1 Tax=Adhaeretor mobilis TaxID=1930276 RepID=A0A517N357_9BACT|nr:hypothetical protein HG15A2_49110 [Adhaeretor mobilis]